MNFSKNIFLQENSKIPDCQYNSSLYSELWFSEYNLGWSKLHSAKNDQNIVCISQMKFPTFILKLLSSSSFKTLGNISSLDNINWNLYFISTRNKNPVTIRSRIISNKYSLHLLRIQFPSSFGFWNKLLYNVCHSKKNLKYKILGTVLKQI